MIKIELKTVANILDFLFIFIKKSWAKTIMLISPNITTVNNNIFAGRTLTITRQISNIISTSKYTIAQILVKFLNPNFFLPFFFFFILDANTLSLSIFLFFCNLLLIYLLTLLEN